MPRFLLALPTVLDVMDAAVPLLEMEAMDLMDMETDSTDDNNNELSVMWRLGWRT